jgi:heme/copper-type cytochrome/quinol oxidase subunit 2
MIKDHRFEPTEVVVPAGVKVRLLVHNADATPEEFESHTLHREKMVPAGAEVVVFVGPLDPGTYEFFGDFNPQTAQGRIIAK